MKYVRTVDGHIYSGGNPILKIIPGTFIKGCSSNLEELFDNIVYRENIHYLRARFIKGKITKGGLGEGPDDPLIIPDRIALAYMDNEYGSYEDPYLYEFVDRDGWKDIKGAIWTCSGLIYVAGIGTDGKWELLDSIQST